MIVFDLDDTLRSTVGCEQFIPDDITKCKNWVEWQNAVNANGTPIESVVRWYNAFNNVNHPCTSIVILTSSCFGTYEWLNRYKIKHPDEVVQRHHFDNRSPFEYKKEFIDEERDNITLWVDDSTEVCNYVESLGIPCVCVQPLVKSPHPRDHTPPKRRRK